MAVVIYLIARKLIFKVSSLKNKNCEKSSEDLKETFYEWLLYKSKLMDTQTNWTICYCFFGSYIIRKKLPNCKLSFPVINKPLNTSFIMTKWECLVAII